MWHVACGMWHVACGMCIIPCTTCYLLPATCHSHTQYVPRDLQALNLAGSFANGHQPRVAVEALHLKLTAIAIATVNLDRIAADTLAHFGGKEFGHRRFFGKRPSLPLQPRRLID